MPRPERLLDPSAGPIQAFAAELRKLRSEAGNPKYLQMARISGRSRTALSEAAGGDHLPTWETTEAFVKACGGDVGAWLIRWESAQEQLAQWASRPSTGAHGAVSEPQADPLSLAADPEPTRTPSTEQRDNDVAILLRLWQEQRTQGRQSENHRAVMTSVVVIGAVGGMGYVAAQPGSSPISAAVGLAVASLGLFGALISAKYYERFKMHMDAAQLIRRRLDGMYPELSLEDDWAANRRQHEGSYPLLSRIRLEHLWIAAHLGISLLGVVVTVVESIR
ncbi:helix-turn-helix domain-containing protein [Nocardia sp. NPDC004750]